MGRLLSKREAEIVVRLQDLCSDSGDTVLACTLLSCVAGDPPSFLEPGDQFAWLQFPVKFAIKSVANDFIRVIVIPVGANQKIVDVIRSRGLPFIFLREGDVSDVVNEVMDARSASPVPGRLMSPPQQLVSQHLREALHILPAQRHHHTSNSVPSAEWPLRNANSDWVRTSMWTLLDEVALGRLVKFDTAPRYVRSFLKTSSVDAVVVATRPVVFPLLVIEFDGVSTHDSRYSRAKDRVKTVLLGDASIPLLRVSTREVKMSRWDRSSSESRAEMAHYLDPMKAIVLELVAKRHAELTSVDSQYQNSLSDLAVARRVGIELFGREFDELNENERGEVFSDRAVRERMDDRYSFAQLENYLDSEAAQERSLEWQLSSRGVSPDRVTNFILHNPTDVNDYWSASARLRGLDGKESPIFSSTVCLRFSNVEPEYLEGLVRNYLVADIANAAWESVGNESAGPSFTQGPLK